MIKNLVAGLSEAGKIKIGKKGAMVKSKKGVEFRPPQRLDHFVLTTTARDENGDYIKDESLMKKLKSREDAMLNKDGELIGLPVRMLYNSVDINFNTRYAAYASARCICSGDGEIAKTRDGRSIPCPCLKLDAGYEGKDKCKIAGKLSVIIDGVDFVGAAHVFRTGSFNSVRSILGSLSLIQAASNGLLAFLPLWLIVTPKAATTPGGQTTTIQVVSVIYRGTLDELRQKTLELSKTKAQFLVEIQNAEQTARQLISESVESDEEQASIAEEFYPDSIDVQPEEPKDKSKVKSKVKSKPKVETVTESPETVTESPDTTTEPTPAPEVESTPSPSQAITKDQKMRIVRLKKDNKITNPDVWAELLKPWGVKSANFLTYDQAEEFIKALNEHPI